MSRATFIRSLQGFPRKAARPDIASIVRAVSGPLGQDPNALMSKARTAPIAHARQEVFRRASLAGCSLVDIARFFGAHHTTVIYGIEAAKKRAA
jgi:chromosomal replication initiation ATPase DnaA